MSKGNKFNNGVWEQGTPEIVLAYQYDTPGQKVEEYVEGLQLQNEKKKEEKRKQFTQVFDNPLKGFPYNEEFEVKEIKEELLSEVQQKEVDALKKLSKDMQAVLKGYQKIAGMGDKELKNMKYNKDYEAVLKSRDTILQLIGKVNTQKILNKEEVLAEGMSKLLSPAQQKGILKKWNEPEGSTFADNAYSNAKIANKKDFIVTSHPVKDGDYYLSLLGNAPEGKEDKPLIKANTNMNADIRKICAKWKKVASQHSNPAGACYLEIEKDLCDKKYSDFAAGDTMVREVVWGMVEDLMGTKIITEGVTIEGGETIEEMKTQKFNKLAFVGKRRKLGRIAEGTLEEDYKKVIKMFPRDNDWKKLITKHKRAIDDFRKNNKDLPSKVEDELLTWASQTGEVSGKHDAEDFILSILDEKCNAKPITENYRTLARKGMGTETPKSVKVGTEIDYYEPKLGDKKMGKVVKMDRQTYSVKDDKSGKVHKFFYHDRMKATKLLKQGDNMLPKIKISIKEKTLQKMGDNLGEGAFSVKLDKPYNRGDEKMYMDIIKKYGGKNLKYSPPKGRDLELDIFFDGGDVKKIKSNLPNKGEGSEWISEKATAQQAAIAIAKKEKAGKPGYDKEGKSLKKESVMNTYRQMWEDGQKYAPQLDEEVSNLTVDPRNKLPKPVDQNKHALEIVKNARRFGLKASMMGKHVRLKGAKKAVNDFLRTVVGRTSYGDPTEKDTSTPQIDKMLTKGLK